MLHQSRKRHGILAIARSLDELVHLPGFRLIRILEVEDRFVGLDERKVLLALFVVNTLFLHTPLRDIYNLVNNIATVLQTVGKTSVVSRLRQKADKIDRILGCQIEARVVIVAINVLSPAVVSPPNTLIPGSKCNTHIRIDPIAALLLGLQNTLPHQISDALITCIHPFLLRPPVHHLPNRIFWEFAGVAAEILPAASGEIAYH